MKFFFLFIEISKTRQDNIEYAGSFACLHHRPIHYGKYFGIVLECLGKRSAFLNRCCYFLGDLSKPLVLCLVLKNLERTGKRKAAFQGIGKAAGKNNDILMAYLFALKTGESARLVVGKDSD